MKCRICGSIIDKEFANLGFQPMSNSYLTKAQLFEPETYLPLRVMVCSSCYLVQTEDYKKPEDIFNSDYAYFSSVSKSWLDHAERYTIDVLERFKIKDNAFIVEIASNDGYLLKNFKRRGLNCLGVEPSKNTAKVAKQMGIDTLEEFFDLETSKKIINLYKNADLVIANNVLAHVPNIREFVLAIRDLLSVNGIVSIEFPHLLQLVKHCQFDTIYHEHYSYLSLNVVNILFYNSGLEIFDVEQIDTHGGSLRIYAQHVDASKIRQKSVEKLISEENSFGLFNIQTYKEFQKRAEKVKNSLLEFLLKANSEGKSVSAYGAAAKGNTLLNFSGIKSDLIQNVYDASAYKQGKYLPGSHIRISDPSELTSDNPDYLIILPWNLKSEIIDLVTNKYKVNPKFVVAVPMLEILN